jgi:hypothetical protein
MTALLPEADFHSRSRYVAEVPILLQKSLMACALRPQIVPWSLGIAAAHIAAPPATFACRTFLF